MIRADTLTFVAAALALAVTPGPDIVLVLRRTVAGGRRDGLLTALGTVSGVLVHATAAILGLSAILATSATAFTVVKIAGAVYLVWLGIRAFAGARKPAAQQAVRREGSAYRQGLVTNVLNPKVAIFFLTFLPQFVGPGDEPVLRIALLSVLFATVGAAVLLLLVTAVHRAERMLTRHRRSLETLSGVVFIAFGARLAFARR